MVTYIDDKTIEREAPAFRQNLAMLNERTQKAGITLVFDADRAMARTDEGLAHRYEIYAAILSAKGANVAPKSKAKGVINVVGFMRQIATLAEITLTQENGWKPTPAANAPESFDDIKILGDAQQMLVASGSKLRIDYDLVRGAGPEAGAYRVRLANEMSKAAYDSRSGAGGREINEHPAFDSPDELLALARRCTRYYSNPAQGSIL